MKKQFLGQKMLLFALVITTALHANSQKVVTIISNKENNYCNGTCTLLNIPELNNNPDAIIMVTPMAKISHTMAAYYIQSKKDTAQWSILNLDNTQMQVGSQFSVEYYVQPDTTHFVHVVTQQNLHKNGSYIDHAGLNDNPNAQIKFFQNLAPIARGGIANNNELKIQYDTIVHRWYMFNTNNSQLSYGDGYNIAISSSAYSKLSPNTGITTISSNPITSSNNSILGQHVYMTVVTLGNTLAGESTSTSTELAGFEMGALQPLTSTGIATGIRTYEPLTIQKVPGPVSLRLFDAFTKNQTVTITIEVYKLTATGATQLDYSIKLTNAKVSYFKQSYTTTGTGTQNGAIDTIKFFFNSIVITSGTITVSDSPGATGG